MLANLAPLRALVHLWQNARMYLGIFTHRDTPLYIKGLVGAAIIYLLSPYDLLPDWFAGLGLIDDIAIVTLLVSFAVRLVNKKKIRKKNGENEDG